MPKAKKKPQKKGPHELDTNVLDLHFEADGTEGGACLTRHSYKWESSCCHRYQARERAANEDAKIYNGKHPGWDVVGDNFVGWKKPYFHMAHHLLPNGVLNGCILEAAQQARSFTLYRLIRMGLLEAEYNLNHKTNMMILPMEPRVAMILRLPRHLELSEASKQKDAKKKTYKLDHRAYSLFVKSKVEAVIQDYAKLLDDAASSMAEHPPVPAKLSKAKLTRISAQMRSMVLDWGQRASGSSLDGQQP